MFPTWASKFRDGKGVNLGSVLGVTGHLPKLGDIVMTLQFVVQRLIPGISRVLNV